MHLSNLDSGKRSVGLTGNRSRRAVKPVRDELFGVVLADSYDAILFVVSLFENIKRREIYFRPAKITGNGLHVENMCVMKKRQLTLGGHDGVSSIGSDLELREVVSYGYVEGGNSERGGSDRRPRRTSDRTTYGYKRGRERKGRVVAM